MGFRHSAAVVGLGLLLACAAHAQPVGKPEETTLPVADPVYFAPRFDHLTIEDGLPQGSIYTILQDHRGFMWFGTDDGLSRYDGYVFETFKHEPFDTTSLSDNSVYCLYEDRSGTLWVGTGDGLNRFDRATETFTRYRHDPADSTSLSSPAILSIQETSDGTLWVGTAWGGLNRMDPGPPARFRRYVHAPDNPRSLGNNTVYAIREGPEGLLWVGTGNGIGRLDPSTGQVDRFLMQGGKAAGGRLPVSGFVFTDSDEPTVFWLPTFRGLVRFDAETGAHTRFLADAEEPSQNIFWDAVPDPRDSAVLWIASRGSGLYRFDTRSERFTNYRHDPDDPASLGADDLLALYADRTGTVWAGSYALGLSRFNPKPGRFALYTDRPGDPHSLSPGLVWGICAPRSDPDLLWVSTAEGSLGQNVLHRIHRRTGAITRYRHDPADPASLGAGLINAILEDHSGTLWVATGSWVTRAGSLSRFNPATGAFSRYRHDPRDPTSLSSNTVRWLYEDRAGTLWVGTYNGGLNRFEASTETFERFQHDRNDPATLSHNYIREIYEDRAGNFWVTTGSGGLNLMDRSSGTFTRFLHDPETPGTISSNDAMGMVERAREPDVLWIGTYGGGLNRLDTKTGAFTVYTEQNSALCNNTVYALLEDEEGRLWMSTNNGLCRFDPDDGTFRHYDVDDGVQGREFNVGAYALSASGEMFFGGTYGLNAFYPHLLAPNATPPQVALTTLKLFNKEGAAGSDSSYQRPLGEAEEIRLSHRHKMLTLGFVALHFKNPKKNRYAYRLDGFDEDWIDAGTQRTATYTNLPPGAYRFRVKAANSDGVWNAAGVSVPLTILPPWWRTTWAYVLYGLLLAAAAALGERLYRRRIVRRERAAALLREKELQAEAAEAYTNYLKAENERQTQELEQARQIQLSMLPETVPEHPLVEIAAHMDTAAEVGGDYYDFDVADDGTLTLAIGDATGHGVQAGTMVTAAKSLFMHCAREDDLVRELRTWSRTLRRLHLPRLYMALALGRLRAQTFELIGAGMPPAFIYHAASGRLEKVALKGMPLGGFADFPYEKRSLSLEAGDTVLLMSDGFPELRSATGEMLGYDHVNRIFAEVAGSSPDEVIAHFNRTAAAWANGQRQHDDITFVVLRVKP